MARPSAHALLAAVVATAALVACAGPAEVSASCAAIVRWHGETFHGHAVDRAVDAGRRFGPGVIPACIDTDPPDPGAHDTTVVLRAVPGIPRTVAFTTRDRMTVYVTGRPLKPSERRALRRIGLRLSR
ncbi:MAG TPA: DUF6281 family protein [Capillimicrobium sp.]|nr:DUF6281 family protein [Capillimicrobium sp.]